MTTASPQDDYRKVARFYDRLLEPVNAPLRAVGLKMYPTDSSMVVLDVGCGTGAHLEAYVDAGAECFGIDASESMLDVARDRLGDRARLELGDARALPHEDATFDLVFISLVLHELETSAQEQMLAEMARVTKPDGRILVIDYRNGPLRLKGRTARVVSFVAERIAGRRHYQNWRTYLRSGGLPQLAESVGLSIEREKIVSGGNLSLWLLLPPSS